MNTAVGSGVRLPDMSVVLAQNFYKPNLSVKTNSR